MIKINRGDVEIEGVWAIVRTEFAELVHSLHYDILTDKLGMSPEESKEEIMKSVEDGLRTKDEIENDAKEALKSLSEFMGGLSGVIEKILAGKEEK